MTKLLDLAKELHGDGVDYLRSFTEAEKDPLAKKVYTGIYTRLKRKSDDDVMYLDHIALTPLKAPGVDEVRAVYRVKYKYHKMEAEVVRL